LIRHGYAESIVETIREPLVVLDADLRVISANRSFYQTFHVKPDETENQPIYNLGNRQWDIPELRQLLEEILSENTAIEDYMVEHDFPDIGRRVMLLNARRLYREANETQLILLSIEDITERKRLEEDMVRHDKLIILGELAGGVGHELRNPLGVIKNAVYFLNMALEEPEPEVKETLEILEKEVATSERIISSLLDFARTKPPIREKLDVNEIIQEAMSQVTIPEKVEVVNQLDEALPTIFADPSQLVQVFSNIILNAIQAMPEGGQLTVKSETPVPRWVAVSFTDTGVGISKEDLGKIFEPLFTTKAKGIGLGLPVSATLIEGHGGTIEVESTEGKGSTFTVKLPLTARE